MRLRKTLIAGAAALTGAAASLQAQAIRGIVVDAGDRPVSGVVVFMLDSTASVVARALSNEAGEFHVAAARAGTYRLRTLRIGYRPATTEGIALLRGGEVERRVALTGAQVSLDTVRIVDRNSCRVMSDASAAATFAVLEQARTALSAAQLTLSGRSISATTTAYDRTLDAEGRRVTQQSQRTATAYVTQPWRAISPDSAHRAGFVFVGNDNSTTYFAPSIDVLLSNVFVEDHCFRLVRDRKQPNAVGVAFEPSPDRRRSAEIKGTLWVDRRSSELQRLDYRYVNIASEQEDAGAGGDVSFARLSNGGWVISRWNIRMPVLEQVIRTQALGGTQVRVAAIQVAGGEITLATRARGAAIDTLWSKPGPTMNGTVVDSARGRPIANARVDLVGANAGGTTDARGRFSIPSVLPGTYLVETVTPELAAIGAANQSTITFADTSDSYEIKVPTPAQLIAALCAGRTLTPSEAAIVGRVHQRGDTLPAVGARVVGEWTAIMLRDEHGVAVERTVKRIEGKTGPDGMYRLCGVPINTNITVTASTESATSGARPVYSASPIVRMELPLDREVATTATFAGRVLVDSTTAPIEGAEIFFPELSKVARSVAGGEFRVPDIPPGKQHVVVRRVGFSSLDTTLSFAADEARRDVFLSRVRILDSVVVTDRMTERILRDFEENRRLGIGHFMDRAELAKTPDAKLSRLVASWPGVQFALGTGNRAWLASSRRAPAVCPPGVISPNTPLAYCYESQGYYVPDQTEITLGVKVACYSQVWVDDVLMNRGNPTRPFELTAMFAEQIEALEWYASASETPGRYADPSARCGVLVIHTRRT
jgi:hypothetical protein